MAQRKGSGRKASGDRAFLKGRKVTSTRQGTNTGVRTLAGTRRLRNAGVGRQ